jgi:hypothetical protein
VETVLVAGGDIGGLTTAITLRHQGIDALPPRLVQAISIAAVNSIADRIEASART